MGQSGLISRLLKTKIRDGGKSRKEKEEANFQLQVGRDFKADSTTIIRIKLSPGLCSAQVLKYNRWTQIIQFSSK
jgi:hypothetical protein